MTWLVLSLLACRTEPTEVVATSPPTVDTDDARIVPPVTADRLSVLGHAQECQQALGPIPGFDCLTDAVAMPVTVGGVPAGPDDATCDKPSLLEGSCNRFTRVGRKEGTWPNGDARPEVTFIFTCRSFDFQEPDEQGGLYHDVAMIGHNEETGATCFFQSFPGTRIRSFPSPLTAGDTPDYGTVDAEEIWDPPADTADINCHRCHGADPWVHSPWIDQLEDPNAPGEPFVPPTSSNQTPYHIVGTAFAHWQLRHVAPEGNACLACHRMQPGEDARRFIRYSTGEDVGMPLTNTSTSWPASHWMPPEGSPSSTDWEDAWRPHVDALLECALTPHADGCNYQPVPEGDRYIDPEAPPRDTGFDTGLLADTAFTCVDPTERLEGSLATGSTCGAGHDRVRSCGAYGSNGEDVAFQFEAPSEGIWVFDTVGSDFDTTLSARTGCAEGDVELACNDDTQGLQSEIALALTEGQRVVLVVDTYEGPECGSFQLNVTSP